MLGIDLDIHGTLAILCILCILTVCIFEFVNGFHDTANAVATVIYTKSLKPIPAVIWSGIMNFLGVLTSSYLFGMAVASKIASLLPLESVLSQNINEAIAMIVSALIGAILWNLGTWYYGIPCSSSHTMIGSLLGVGIVFSLLPESGNKVGVNWSEALKIGNSLLVSPIFGFTMAIALMFILKSFIKDKTIFKEPENNEPPPPWLRFILICTCTLVSFFHGSNDGQKGVGLMLIVLMAFMPIQFALSPDFKPNEFKQTLSKMKESFNRESTYNYEMERTLCASADKLERFEKYMDELDVTQGRQLMIARKQMSVLSKELKVILAEPNLISKPENQKLIKEGIYELNHFTSHVPAWVILIISLSLGIGTMVGWRRIVVTIGEKIGKRHMTFAEGASAEIVASSTIGLASGLGLPVSTTHVLSSGVAGAMVATKGIKNLQKGTVKSIILAWVLTLPATILISGALYLILRHII
ncbi:MAG: inorganic phosphate transporter [Saprospiraceae bacterium]|nr:inorganic phosphate transporter [Saprospiraceae bacterium]MBK9721615.1 inorganic phosphate transporter [Saprospiraceae bacterium]MBK9728680.1 inorganic phosphate transporter [Saprospiraceae bacterium]